MSLRAMIIASTSAVLLSGCDRASPPAPAASATLTAEPSARVTARDGAPAPPASASAATRPAVPLYVKIPIALSPLERQERFVDPLDVLLRSRNLGEVRRVADLGAQSGTTALGVDCTVSNFELALPLVREKLRELRAPRGTVIEEEQGQTTVAHPVW